MSKEGIREVLQTYCDGAVKEYVDKHLKPRFQVGLVPHCMCMAEIVVSPAVDVWVEQPAAAACIQALRRTCLSAPPTLCNTSHRTCRPTRTTMT